WRHGETLTDNLLLETCCPFCYAPLELEVSKYRDSHVYEGTFTCSACGRKYPLIEGIALLAVIDSTWSCMIKEMLARIETKKKVASEGGLEKDKQKLSEQVNLENRTLADGYFDNAVERLRVGKGTRVLDVGAGLCEKTRYFADLGAEVVAQDVELYHLSYVRFWDDKVAYTGSLPTRNPEVYPNYFYRVLGDAHRIPFEDATFDITYCRSTLHHLHSCSQAIREMARVTKPGGTVLLISEPLRSILDPKYQYLDGNVDYEAGMNEQLFTITTYTIPLGLYCGDIEVTYFRPDCMESTKKVFRALRLNRDKIYSHGERISALRSLKLLFTGAGVNLNGRKLNTPIGKPRKINPESIIATACDLAPMIQGPPVEESEGAAQTPADFPDFKKRLEEIYISSLKPDDYSESLDLFTARGPDLRGWRAPEKTEDNGFRYTQRRAICIIKNDKSSNWLVILMQGYPQEAGKASGRVVINGRDAGTYSLEGGWSEVSFEKPSAEDILMIEIINDFTFIPDEVLGNGDVRELGVAVSKIWQAW
ncbi:MAG: methyltransferase domain-containing protein, partial [Actinomycetota bacterium]|nr:methyltransferase domain-containing protein [Actinomycetota bacterium]